MADIRHCHNLLATTCKRPEVVEAHLGCFGLNGSEFNAAAVAFLRSAIRRELGTRKKLAEDPERAFIATVPTTVEAQEGGGAAGHP